MAHVLLAAANSATPSTVIGLVHEGRVGALGIVTLVHIVLGAHRAATEVTGACAPGRTLVHASAGATRPIIHQRNTPEVLFAEVMSL